MRYIHAPTAARNREAHIENGWLVVGGLCGVDRSQRGLQSEYAGSLRSLELWRLL
jgi:hypothetical protein